MIRRAFLALVAMLGLVSAAAAADQNIMVIEISGKATGTVEIQLLPDVAPKHVAQIKALIKQGAYDNVAFHRVIEGFMAQTGDVEFGTKAAFAQGKAGTGGSKLPDLPAEFSKIPFERGTVGMARAQDPNSANSQFFITFQPTPFLDGQYTVVGKVISGMDVVDRIQRGSGQNGMVDAPDWMTKVTLK